MTSVSTEAQPPPRRPPFTSSMMRSSWPRTGIQLENRSGGNATYCSTVCAGSGGQLQRPFGHGPRSRLARGLSLQTADLPGGRPKEARAWTIHRQTPMAAARSDSRRLPNRTTRSSDKPTRGRQKGVAAPGAAAGLPAVKPSRVRVGRASSPGGRRARESPTPCMPFIQVWALSTECGVITMPGIDNGAVTETVEDSRLHVLEQ